MSMDYLTLGSTPCGESCAQVGTDDYYQLMKREARAYIAQLKRMFPDWESHNVRFTNKSHPHDCGTYHEVAIVFSDADESAVEFAYNVENNLPESWDDQALIALLPTLGDCLASDLANGPNSRYDRTMTRLV